MKHKLIVEPKRLCAGCGCELYSLSFQRGKNKKDRKPYCGKCNKEMG